MIQISASDDSSSKPYISMVVKLGTLKLLESNSEFRYTHSRRKNLIESIKLRGLLTPIAVDRDMVIGDGNSRVYCMLNDPDFGPNYEVEVFVYLYLNASEIFNQTNGKDTKLSTGNRDYLCAWIHGDVQAIGDKEFNRIDRYNRYFTRDFMTKIYHEGQSIETFKAIKNILDYCSRTSSNPKVTLFSEEEVNMVYSWVLSNRYIWICAKTSFIKKVHPLALWKGIVKNKPCAALTM